MLVLVILQRGGEEGLALPGGGNACTVFVRVWTAIPDSKVPRPLFRSTTMNATEPGKRMPSAKEKTQQWKFFGSVNQKQLHKNRFRTKNYRKNLFHVWVPSQNFAKIKFKTPNAKISIPQIVLICRVYRAYFLRGLVSNHLLA